MKEVNIYLDKDEWRGMKPLHEFIMKLLMEMEISGATSFEGFSGFGKHHRLKRPTQQYSFDETPMLITFTDTEEKVKEALIELRKHYKGGFITTHTVESW